MVPKIAKKDVPQIDKPKRKNRPRTKPAVTPETVPIQAADPIPPIESTPRPEVRPIPDGVIGPEYEPPESWPPSVMPATEPKHIGTLASAILGKELHDEVRKQKMEKKIKAPRPPKRLFSESHPRAFAIAKAVLPRLQTFGLAIGLLIAAMLELFHRNVDFVLDWYQGSYFGPAIVDILTKKGRMETWFSEYGPVFIIILMVIIGLLFTFYICFWRMWFKAYTKRSENSDTYEGRCYWRTNNMWVRMWDRRYHSPPRTMVQYWLHTGWLPLFNIFNPNGCMIVLETTIEEKCESKGVYNIVVNEKPLRRLVGYKTYRTFDTGFFHTGPIPLAYAQGEFDERSQTLVDDTMNLSFGNADNRNSLMKDGLRMSNNKLRRYIIDDRKRKQDSDRPDQ